MFDERTWSGVLCEGAPEVHLEEHLEEQLREHLKEHLEGVTEVLGGEAPENRLYC